MIPASRKYLFAAFMILGMALCLLFDVPESWSAGAAGKITPGRKLWDNILLWVNFAVLVFFFIKYARKPFMDYLRSVRSKMEKDITIINDQKDSVKSLKDAEADKLKTVDQYIQEIRESILEIGRKEKEKAIQEGKMMAEKMIEDANIYSQYKMAMARKALSDEMVDVAVEKAAEKLAQAISENDEEALINDFIANLKTAKHTS